MDGVTHFSEWLDIQTDIFIRKMHRSVQNSSLQSCCSRMMTNRAEFMSREEAVKVLCDQNYNFL